MKKLVITQATAADLPEISNLLDLAFKSTEESILVKNLLKDPSAQPVLSLCARLDDEICGHILFTKAHIERDELTNAVYILAPMAVHPQYQSKGIGQALIHEGHQVLRSQGVKAIFVLGHMDYYPRSGYTPNAQQLGYAPTYDIPTEVADAWMVHYLDTVNNKLPIGRIICADALNKAHYWKE